MEEVNFGKLPIEERCQHKAWKARLSGYEAALNLFQDLDDDKSPEYLKYLGLLNKFVNDNNAIAQEKGLAAVLVFVKNAACAPETAKDVMSVLISKCFSSSRAKTKKLALEITLMYIEIEAQDIVLEELIKGFENKSPEIVTTSVVAVREALHAFGSKVISIKSIMRVLVKLLEDRYKDVREESKQLCVEIYRWVGNAMKILLQSLRPVTLTEMEKEFEKIAGQVPVPSRYLKSQQEKMAESKENGEVANDAALNGTPPRKMDIYDTMPAVDILSKLPKNFYEHCEAKKWLERKEALESLLPLTSYVKFESGDYGDLVMTLKKLIGEDFNISVVILSTKCLTNLINGLRERFQPYASQCIPTIFEKLKEKKQRVVLALREIMDALYSVSSLEAMTEDILFALNNKNTQVKAETAAFLARAFCTCTPAQLDKKLLKTFIPSLLKTLNDSDAIVRDNSAEAIGTALKVVGERNMELLLYTNTELVDSIKKAKIDYFCAKAVINAKTEPIVESKTIFSSS